MNFAVALSLQHPLIWMTLLHLAVSLSALLIRNWRQSFLQTFRMVGVGGLVAVLTLHVDFEHFHEGQGLWSAVALVGAFALMVVAHNFPSHKAHHVNCHEHGSHPFVSYWWVVALLIHSTTDGYLLGISEDFSVQMQESVWAFLAVHKILEAVWVSSLLAIEFKKRTLFALIGVYAVTFPLGYAIPYLLRSQAYFSPESLEFIFQIAGSLSMGSLLACVVVDQIIPSVKNVRKDLKQILWFAAGFALTHILLFLSEGSLGSAIEHHHHH